MKRREFIALVGSATAAVPFAARGQNGERRVGIISGFVASERAKEVEAFTQSLTQKGWVEGKNLHIEYLSADGDAGRLPALAEELAASKPSVILAMATPALVAMRKATGTVPSFL